MSADSTLGDPPSDDGEHLPIQRVAVTVFAEVRACDERDGAYIVEQFLRERSDWGHVQPYEPHAGHPRPLIVREVMDAGMALGNGHLWARPTDRVYRTWTHKEEL